MYSYNTCQQAEWGSGGGKRSQWVLSSDSQWFMPASQLSAATGLSEVSTRIWWSVWHELGYIRCRCIVNDCTLYTSMYLYIHTCVQTSLAVGICTWRMRMGLRPRRWFEWIYHLLLRDCLVRWCTVYKQCVLMYMELIGDYNNTRQLLSAAVRMIDNKSSQCRRFGRTESPSSKLKPSY